MAACPEGGAVALEGIPFEVRWGTRATSARVPVPPPCGMIQVNTRNENSRHVHRGAPGPAPRAADKPADVDACVALAEAARRVPFLGGDAL